MKAGIIIQSIFKTFLLSLCIIGQVHFAYAVDQSIIPPGKTTFFDSNGNPLSSGKVYFYVPSTTTPKATYQDFGGTIANSQPVTLDAAGRALIWGTGQYRQVVKDRNNNTIWDVVTSAAGSGSSGPTATGDGDLVGTIKPWAGMTAPNQYQFAYGQEISRTTFSALYTAITSSQSVFCNSGSPTLNGLGDTSNFWIGMSLEISCVAAGFTTVVSKTASSVTMAASANTTTNTTAIFYPWGRGNGATTFNVPDLRGVVLAGNDIMGGVASGRLTTSYFGATNPQSSGALGGNQSTTLIASNIPTLTATNPTTAATSSTSTVSDIVRAPAGVTSSNAGGGANGQLVGNGSSIAAISSTGTAAINAVNTITNSGGIATSAVVAAVGSGYTPGAQTITLTGGTCTTFPQFTVTISGGGAFSGTPALLTAGSCTVTPPNPAATSGGGGSGGTLNVSYSAQPVSVVQPTRTTNYIIKVTPDANSATASGVTSLGLMTGDIACGSGLLCTGNNISVSQANISVNSTTVSNGTNTRILYDNNGLLGEYNISGTGTVAMTTSPVFVTPTLGVASGTTLALGGCTISTNAFCTTGTQSFGGTTAIFGATTIQSSSAAALAVGPNGATNSTFNVNAASASQATGITVVGAVAGGGAAIQTTSPNTNEQFTLQTKGNGTLNLSVANGGTINIGSTASASKTINLGGNGGGVNVNLGAAGDGLNTLNVYTGAGSLQTWISGGGSTTIQFPQITDTLVTRTNTETLTNKTISGSSNTLSNIANGSLATMAANTIKGNATGGSATPTDISIPALTQKVAPVANDKIMIADSAATDQLKYATVASISSAGSVSSIAGNTGAFTLGVGLTNSVNDLRVSLSTVSNILGADVNLNNTASYFDGPSMAQGTSGTWAVNGTVSLTSTSTDSFNCKLWDGTTVISSSRTFVAATGVTTTLTLTGFLTNPAANIKISCKDVTSVNGKIVFNATGESKDSSIFGHRIAP